MGFAAWTLGQQSSVQQCLLVLLYVGLIPENTQLDTHGIQGQSCGRSVRNKAVMKTRPSVVYPS